MDGVFQISRETLFKVVAKEATKRILRPTYEAIENIVKQTVNRNAADQVIRSRFDILAESWNFVQSIFSCLMKRPSSRVPITELFRRHPKISFMKEANIYDPSTIVGKKSSEGTLPL